MAMIPMTIQQDEPNALGEVVDISGYTPSNQYTCPSDGYITLGSETVTSGTIRVVIFGSRGSSRVLQYMNITDKYQCDAVYVRKGMKVYLAQAAPSGTVVRFIPFV